MVTADSCCRRQFKLYWVSTYRMFGTKADPISYNITYDCCTWYAQVYMVVCTDIFCVRVLATYTARELAQLSRIAQALKICADDLPPIAQALKTCADELSPIAQASKTCAKKLPPIAQAGGNMCSSCSSDSSSRGQMS